mmetsp:Transcript_29383/g.84469  ORF Transcript_29383/g.84469 Transcript_29383/m.84469 type:complete len:431 (+) Transcript_29383:119-1411(+)|eukprot:CAMPEP_0176080664 /NCGR_PEP_ID=MMETSP0120_2-20121206/40349_1 /TAXON_ID=160619 /ORGANISM="Kryptoperidinium foliaceum, Strain CCMP 1326" /LENGTH=430 /DNA_ID=CAMNT_0017414431 /DNA_START=52 /DNA_END=1344 /DNA_ORIENTATION=+
MSRSAARLLALVFFCLRLVASKVQVVRFVLGNNGTAPPWLYVSKFGFGLGVGDYQFRIRQLHPPAAGVHVTLDFEPYLDERWPAAEAIEDECKRRAHATRIIPVTSGEGGEWGAWTENSVEHVVRPHVWYFAISSCSSQLPNGSTTFEVELHATQHDGSHFSVESGWSLYSNVLSLIVSTWFFRRLGLRCLDFRSWSGSLHPVIWMFAGIVAVQYIAQLLHIAHLFAFVRDGRGVFVVEALAEALQASSHVMQTSLMLLIAMGYTLTRSTLGDDLRLCLPACTLLTVAQIFAVMAERSQDEASYTFTSHEGTKGWTMLASRLALFWWFSRAVRATAAEGGNKLRKFLERYRVAASLYLLAYPIVWLLMPLFAPYWRKWVMDFGLGLVQICANVWLASVFLDRGPYLEVSSLGACPLPGGDTSPPRFYKDE